jgi:hypothetical protein
VPTPPPAAAGAPAPPPSAAAAAAAANEITAGVVGGENLEGASNAQAAGGLGTWLDRKMEGILSANRTLVIEQAKVAAGARVEQVGTQRCRVPDRN